MGFLGYIYIIIFEIIIKIKIKIKIINLKYLDFCG
jgi:hypothetical protein